MSTQKIDREATKAARSGKFSRGDRVRKVGGSQWEGIVVGEYSTTLTPEGYAVESCAHAGSVQIYPAKALELVSQDNDCAGTGHAKQAGGRSRRSATHASRLLVSPALRRQRLRRPYPRQPDRAWGWKMNGAEIDCLVALVERGPLWDGDVPSKRGRDSLIEQGLAVRIIVDCQDGYTAATYAGRDAYKRNFGGDVVTIKEAKADRLARLTITKAAEFQNPKEEG